MIRIDVTPYPILRADGVDTVLNVTVGNVTLRLNPDDALRLTAALALGINEVDPSVWGQL